ncbi:hypothetical protein M413DRAFT_22154 [Hebeloma cylindrosporum]|uniref:Stearoyl-CoA 9-desaturase n=1 Tax=Hebeloma cylindrosporum TaxID=76867 RepID=A0A0C3CFI6_HEBCY|nr:hypothetical protein M413DRAFT_22154 [Hebeloma cylindrosporum h7]
MFAGSDLGSGMLEISPGGVRRAVNASYVLCLGSAQRNQVDAASEGVDRLVGLADPGLSSQQSQLRNTVHLCLLTTRISASSLLTTHFLLLFSRPQIWWSNAVFFTLVHLGAIIGIYYMPPWSIKRATLVLWFLTWQLSDFGITIGYHRLYSHKAFRATVGVRIILAILGSSAFQGSIKHHLHLIYPLCPYQWFPTSLGASDTGCIMYAATRGLFYSHMGWIFYKPTYERMDLIDRHDLQSDPVVRIQHKYYVPLALFFGFVCPTLLGSLWGDALGGFLWGGLVAKLCIWHCTFLVNSLAHWDGLQPYSDEDTSRGSLILALLTGGEGNHNFHSFPHDFRSGPSNIDWDPSKWIILALEKLGLEVLGIVESEDNSWTGEMWNLNQVKEFAQTKPGSCIVLIDGFAVDISAYLGEHPGGANILRKYSLRLQDEIDTWHKADWAFNGGLNNHSRAAKRRMYELRVAKLC